MDARKNKIELGGRARSACGADSFHFCGDQFWRNARRDSLARADLFRARNPRDGDAIHRAEFFHLRNLDEQKRRRSALHRPLDSCGIISRPRVERIASRHVLHAPAQKRNGHALATCVFNARTRALKSNFGTHI